MTMNSMLHVAAIFIADAMSGLRPIEDLLPPTSWERHGSSVLSLCLLATAVVVLILRLRWSVRLGAVNQSPVASAMHALHEIECRPENSVTAAAVLRALRQYLAVVMPGWPAGELTADEMVRSLNIEASLSPELKGEISLLIRQCERRQFLTARSSGSGQFAARALALIDRIEAMRAVSKTSDEAQPDTLLSHAKSATAPSKLIDVANTPPSHP